MNDQAQMPALKIRNLMGADETTRVATIEEGRALIEFTPYGLVMVDSKAVRSYDELVQLLKQAEFRGKEVVEVVVLPYLIEGG